MTAQLLQQTYLPEPDDELAELLDFFKPHSHNQSGDGSDDRANRRAGRAGKGVAEPRYYLAGDGRRVELPEAFHRVLLQVIEAMKAGKAVTVAPQSQLLTTQQAADLLGVSRPTVVKLIDQGALPALVPGKRRRMIKLDDLLEYRDRRRDSQYRALVETSVDYDEELESPEASEERFRRVRAEVAAARRARSSGS